MDVNDFIRITENGDGCEHWVDKQLPTSDDHALKEKDNAASSCCLGNEELTVRSGNTVTLKDVECVDSSPSELLKALPAKEQNDSVHSSKELGVIKQAGLKDGKPHKVAAKTTNQKLSSLKTAATTGLKKVKNGKNVTTSTASTESLGIRPKSKSSNDNQTSDLRVKHHKPVPGAAKVKYPKQSGQAQPISPSASVSHNETHMEKTKLRLGKKSRSSKSEGTAQSSSPTSSEEKTRNVGALPAYSFSFKCDERAEKRREFYSKLEEKIQAKEAEKSNLQEKSKETHEAELRMLRKKLMFKATPMPSFYQEPAPPKTELKKEQIPPTRAKSPKLGRRKSSHAQVSEEESDAKTHPSKSLDEKLAQSIIAKSSPINNVKRPLRKSLPKLPSQKTISPNETKRPSARKTSLSKEAIQSAPQQNKSSDETSEAAADVQKQEDEAIIDPSQTQIDNKIEPVADSEAEASLVCDHTYGALSASLLMSPVY